MRMTLLASVTAATLGLFSAANLPEPAPAVAGPGGVIVAVEGLLAAIDRSDRAAIETLLIESPHDYTVAYGKDGKAMHDSKARPDVAMIRDPFVQALPEVDGKAGIRHRIRAIRANCPAEECSYGVVEFDRIQVAGDEEKVTPMRATVLTRYDRKAQKMRIFLWQVAPAE